MQSVRSAKPRLLTSRLTLPFVMLSALGLQACGTVTPRAPTLTISDSLRAKCVGPVSPMRTVGDLASFAKDQEAALQECDKRRAAVVAIVDSAQPKKRKRFGLF
jgi:hypothetical protein